MIPRQQLWQANRDRSVQISGQRLRIRQTVSWAAAGTSSILKLGRFGKRLILVQYDYRGEPLKDTVVYRNLKFLNSDLQLDLPMLSICQLAKEWLEKAGDDLILNLVEEKLPDLEAKPQEIGKFMQLLAAQDLASSRTFAVLVLNA